MKKSISLLTNLLTSSTLFWGVPTVETQDVTLSVRTETTSYCHIEFPVTSEHSLYSGNPVLNESASNSIDFYRSCDRDSLGRDEIRAPRELIMPFADGDFRR
jgi:hypothetical protein